MKVGIVGLPNVGKSTLFNAFVRRQQALSANYPFATIEPNIGIVDVPGTNIDLLATISKSGKVVYSNITFVDIAGIVSGAHKGDGLGNQFLSHIREVDLILVLLRDFDDNNIVREGSTTPDEDFNVITTELILRDLQTIDKYLSVKKKHSIEHLSQALLTAKEGLERGAMVYDIPMSSDERKALAKMY